MLFKKIRVVVGCAIVFSCAGADNTQPRSPRTPLGRIAPSQSTPPPRRSSPFWRGESSADSSPASSAGGSPLKSDLLSPTKSPLGKRKADEAFSNNNRSTLPNVARRLNFDAVSRVSIADALEAASVQKALAILRQLPPVRVNLEVTELKQHLPEPVYDVGQYDDISVAVVKYFNDKFKGVHGGRPLDFLPLLSVEHMREGDRAGGYHFESQDKPVQKIIENPVTRVYAGSFEQGRRRKISSFFPKGWSAGSIQDIHEAFRHPVVSDAHNIIGKTTDGSYIQMILQPSGIVARTAFPLVEYISAETPDQQKVMLKHNSCGQQALEAHTYTAAELRALAGCGRLELQTDDKKVIDVAGPLTGLSEARGVYVEMPTN